MAVDGAADKWLDAVQRDTQSRLEKMDPARREGYKAKISPWIAAKYEELKRHERREVRKGRIERLERELANLEIAKSYGFIDELKRMRGGNSQFNAQVKAMVKAMGAFGDDGRNIIQDAIKGGLITQGDGDLRQKKFRRTIVDSVIRTLIVSGRCKHADSIFLALESDDAQIAKELGYSPYDLSAFRRAAKERRAELDVEARSRGKQTAEDEASDVPVTGTGWFVNSNHVVTCCHVIDGAIRLSVVSRSGKKVVAKEVAREKASDLAILEVVGLTEPHNALPIRGRTSKIADKVWTIGYPLPSLLGQEQKYSEGVVSATSGLSGDVKCYQVSVPLQPGNSGGALMDESGCVVGIVSSGLDAIRAAIATGSIPQNVNYAVKSRYLTTLLDDNGIEYDDRQSATGQAALIDAVNSATVLVVAERAVKAP